MGVPGLWEVLKPASRVLPLAEIVTAHPRGHIRLAVDVSIWSFQCSAARGGENPGLRTFYFRLCRLLALGVRAVFVFDGENRPVYKRGIRKRAPSRMTRFRELAVLFGFQTWQAPGEAEAECAKLQRLGYVDAVLSDDVDCLMFGATKVYRHWGQVVGEDGKSDVSCAREYCAERIRSLCSLDAPGMQLIALMSGGDYAQTGVPACGIKTAVEAAIAGFGSDLGGTCISTEARKDWRHRLQAELSCNVAGYFSRKRKHLLLPESFPESDLVQFYSQPVTSAQERLQAVFEQTEWWPELSLQALETFCAVHLDWTGEEGQDRLRKTLCLPYLLYVSRRAQALGASNSFSHAVYVRGSKNEGGRKLVRIEIHPHDVVDLSASGSLQSPARHKSQRFWVDTDIIAALFPSAVAVLPKGSSCRNEREDAKCPEVRTIQQFSSEGRAKHQDNIKATSRGRSLANATQHRYRAISISSTSGSDVSCAEQAAQYRENDEVLNVSVSRLNLTEDKRTRKKRWERLNSPELIDLTEMGGRCSPVSW